MGRNTCRLWKKKINYDIIIFRMRLIKQEKISLYIDNDEKYHFIVGEMLRKENLKFASNCESALKVIKENSGKLGTIMFCIDDMDHFYFVNELFNLKNSYEHLIILSKYLDAFQMYELITAYGAEDYITKPFTKQAIFTSYHSVKKMVNKRLKRLINDLLFFNESIRFYNNKFKLDHPMSQLGLGQFGDQINHLTKIKNKLDQFIEFPKSRHPNILFVEDEKSIIHIYQNFVKEKPFRAFYSETLKKESKEIIKREKIDIIILDLGLGDGHGIELLYDVYDKDCTSFELPDVVVISSGYEKETVVDVINAGAKVFINKPMTYKKFISVIYQLTFLRYMRQELKLTRNNESALSK